MSATSRLLLKFLIIASTTNLLPLCTGSALNSHHTNSNPSNHNNNNNHNPTVYQNHGLFTDGQRNLEAQVSRVLGRMDQLDMRVGRLQALIQLRFDNIESSYTTTNARLQLRMELWGDELNRMEEQLSRKWKIMESKLDTMLGNMDSKLDTKLTAVQRDNRRYQEFLSNAFNTVAVGQEKVKEKLISSMNEVNSTLQVLTITAKNYTNRGDSSSALLVQNSDKMLNILQDFVSNASSTLSSASLSSSQSGCRGGGEILSPSQTIPPNYATSTSSTSISGGGSELLQNNQTTATAINQYQLLGNKVTNMFEDLMRRSSNMETMLKDVVSIANVTKKDMHDGFRTVLASSPSSLGSSLSSSHNSRSNNHNNIYGQYNSRSSSGSSSGYHNGGNGNGASSSELMSSVIVEALASVDTMSTALGRKITELGRSIDERFEMVSMSINGFLESCVRIQDNQPLIEDHIADLLIKIINTVDNSTKSASELWLSVANQILDERDNFTKSYTGCFESQHYEEETAYLPQETSTSSNSIGNRRSSSGGESNKNQPNINPTITTSTTTFSPNSNNRNNHHVPNSSSSNSFETLLQAGNELTSTNNNNNIIIGGNGGGRTQSQSLHRQSPILISQPTQTLSQHSPRYEEEGAEDVFEDNEEEVDPELDSGGEEHHPHPETTTTFPEESNNSNKNTDTISSHHHHHHQRHNRRPKPPSVPISTSSITTSSSSSSTNRGRVSSSASSRTRNDGEILTEEEKEGIWTRLVLSQGQEEGQENDEAEEERGGPST